MPLAAAYYQLAEAAKKQLISEHCRWKQLSTPIVRLMNPSEEGAIA